MKKTIAALMAVAMLSTNAYAADFTDIRGHWAENDINILADRGIVNGVSEGVFSPDGEVTRVQYLKMVMETVGMETVDHRPGECLDAKSTDWYAPYLQSVLDKGLIPEAMVTGYSANVIVERDEDGKALSSEVRYYGSFYGNEPITREEAAYITMSLYQYTLNPNTMSSLGKGNITIFTDMVDIEKWALPAVELAVQSGVITGMDDSSFKPKNTATRAQAAVMINRLIGLMEG